MVKINNWLYKDNIVSGSDFYQFTKFYIDSMQIIGDVYERGESSLNEAIVIQQSKVNNIYISDNWQWIKY